MSLKDPRYPCFISLFNETHFFEAHEVLEDLWMESQEPLKSFYKGLIQVAVAFAHWKRMNHRGANQVGKRGMSILRNFLPRYENIQVAELIRDCEEFLSKPGMEFPRIKTSSD